MDLDVATTRQRVIKQYPELFGLRLFTMRAFESEVAEIVAARIANDRPELADDPAALQRMARFGTLVGMAAMRSAWHSWIAGASVGTGGRARGAAHAHPRVLRRPPGAAAALSAASDRADCSAAGRAAAGGGPCGNVCLLAVLRATAHAALAQSAEHLTRNEKVKGSIPLGGSQRKGPRTRSLSLRPPKGVVSVGPPPPSSGIARRCGCVARQCHVFVPRLVRTACPHFSGHAGPAVGPQNGGGTLRRVPRMVVARDRAGLALGTRQSSRGDCV